MSDMKSIAAGLFTGMIAAGSAALLTTPKSGKAVRDNMRDKSNELQQGFKQFKDDCVEVKNQLVQTKASIPVAKETAKEIKEEIDHWKNDIEPNMRTLQSSMSEAQNTVEQLQQIQK